MISEDNKEEEEDMEEEEEIFVVILGDIHIIKISFSPEKEGSWSNRKKRDRAMKLLVCHQWHKSSTKSSRDKKKYTFIYCAPPYKYIYSITPYPKGHHLIV